MGYRLTRQEFVAVLQLPSEKRSGYMVKRIVDTEEAWVLEVDDGFVISSDGDREYVPIWPFAEFARACASGAWEGAKPTVVPLEEMEEFLIHLREQGIALLAFPTPEGDGFPIECDTFAQALDRALEWYA